MIETLTILTLGFLYLVFIRPGKTPPLNNPLVIERPGQYHMTLAPQLNLAQPLIEAIAKQFAPSGDTTQNSATQYFEVRDKQVTAHGSDSYLLAITQRNGMLYFQATRPQVGSSDSDTVAKFSSAVLARFPATGENDVVQNERVITATQQVAGGHSVNIKPLA
jgi:hypothetical protein